MASAFVLIASCVAVLACGCGRDNGLSGDLTKHLDSHGISIQVLGSEAPLSSRAGFLFFAEDPDTEQKIIVAFDLKPVEQGSDEFLSISAQIAETPKALWGISGRPAKLKLEGGLQFDYLYLLQTMDGRTYLFAQYAYG